MPAESTLQTTGMMALAIAAALVSAGCTAVDGNGNAAPAGGDPVLGDQHDVGDHHDHHDHDHGHGHGAGGDPGPHDGSTGTLPVMGNETRTLRVVGGAPDEFRFDPETSTVVEGERVAVSFANEGTIEHELAIPELDFHLHAGPGETVEGAFVAPQHGTYTIGCYVPGHFESGMRGTLEVTANG